MELKNFKIGHSYNESVIKQALEETESEWKNVGYQDIGTAFIVVAEDGLEGNVKRCSFMLIDSHAAHDSIYQCLYNDN